MTRLSTTKQVFTKMVSLHQITSEGKVTYKTPEDFVHSDRTVIAMILLGLSHLEKDNLLADDPHEVQLDWADIDSVDRRSTTIKLNLSSDKPARGDRQKVIFEYDYTGKSIGFRGKHVTSIRRISTDVLDTAIQGLVAAAVLVISATHTHLRAHQTVLVGVFRLLLLKNKLHKLT